MPKAAARRSAECPITSLVENSAMAGSWNWMTRDIKLNAFDPVHEIVPRVINTVLGSLEFCLQVLSSVQPSLPEYTMHALN